jgi:hypothetical protein
MKHRSWILAALAAAAAVSISPAAHADWIVTRAGDRFEIKGTWQLKGKLAVFTLPNGNLSSMRADRIDFDASKQATEKAKKDAAAPPPAEPAKTRRKAVIILTDKDFKKPQLPEGTLGAAAGTAADAANPASPADSKKGKNGPPGKDVPSPVEVTGWDRVPAAESKANGAELTGSVRNTSPDILTEVVVVADLFDDNGGLIGRYTATVDNQQLHPGETSKFRVVAPSVFAFASIRWETQGKGWKAVQPPAAGAAAAPPPSS